MGGALSSPAILAVTFLLAVAGGEGSIHNSPSVDTQPSFISPQLFQMKYRMRCLSVLELESLIFKSLLQRMMPIAPSGAFISLLYINVVADR